MRTRFSTASNSPDALDLARLEHDVAVGEDDRLAEAWRRARGVERAGKQPVGERVVDQERRHRQQVRIARVHQSVALQGAQVVGVAELGAQRLEDLEVQLGPRGADLLEQVAAEVGAHPVVVEQGVVDVEQEDDFVRIAHGSSERLRTSTRPSG